MLYRRWSIFLALALLLVPAGGRAAAPTPAPAPSRTEAAFLATIMRELPKRYPNPAAAEKAGYFRYLNEDETGAISYVNVAHWQVTDPLLPSQLWYDVHGRLLGADYSVLDSSVPKGGKPTTLGIDPKRFSHNGAHVHYVTCNRATAVCTYGKSVSRQRYAKYNGGSYQHPTAAGLVRAGAVKRAADVSRVFLYRGIYDVSVWVVPNPLGQFADKNPAVKPSPAAGKGEDEPLE